MALQAAVRLQDQHARGCGLRRRVPRLHLRRPLHHRGPVLRLHRGRLRGGRRRLPARDHRDRVALRRRLQPRDRRARREQRRPHRLHRQRQGRHPVHRRLRRQPRPARRVPHQPRVPARPALEALGHVPEQGPDAQERHRPGRGHLQPRHAALHPLQDHRRLPHRVPRVLPRRPRGAHAGAERLVAQRHPHDPGHRRRLPAGGYRRPAPLQRRRHLRLLGRRPHLVQHLRRRLHRQTRR